MIETIDTDGLLKRKKLISLIKNLNNVELNEIYHILKINNCCYTENKNVIFINLTNIDDKILEDIYNFINFSKTKNEELIIKEEILEKHRENITKKSLNENTHMNNSNMNISLYNMEDFTDSCNENDFNIYKLNNKIIYNSKYEDNLNLDDDESLDNVIFKKKKIRYTGAKARIIKSYSNKDKKQDKDND